MDEDKTIPPESKLKKWLRAYVQGEGVFDDFLGWLTGSAWSLAIFTVYTVGLVMLGFWLRK